MEICHQKQTESQSAAVPFISSGAARGGKMANMRAEDVIFLPIYITQKVVAKIVKG